MRHIACALLLASAVTLAAHASYLEHPQETVLDNFDKIAAAGRPSTVVQDWSLVCTYHCSAALAGVPCSCACDEIAENIPRRYQNKTYRNHKLIISSNLLSICGETACSKKFVAAKLAELNKQTPSAQLMTFIDDVYGASVCSNFYGGRIAALDKCDECFRQHTAGVQAFDDVIEPFDETDPDWNELCASLCKTGDGGSLCNCNLSPFNQR